MLAFLFFLRLGAGWLGGTTGCRFVETGVGGSQGLGVLLFAIWSLGVLLAGVLGCGWVGSWQAGRSVGGWNRARGVILAGVRAGGGGQMLKGDIKMSQNMSGGGGTGIIGLARGESGDKGEIGGEEKPEGVGEE